jgi:hypothetical protein
MVAAGALGGPAWADAQTGIPPGRIELGLGVLWSGQTALGTMDATETTGAGGRSTIFGTSTDLTSVAGFEGRLGVRLSRSLEAEASGAYGRPTLRTTISNDVEAGGPVVATETIKEFTIGGAALWYVPWHGLPPRFAPFVTGGAGYLRQLHESGTLGVTGETFQAGGGVKYLLASRLGSRPKSVGLRGDVRLIARRKGVAFDDRLRLSPALGGSIFARF